MSLIKIGNCIFEETLYSLAHGFGGLDEVSKEAFVNHNHFEGINLHIEAEQQIKTWVSEMKKLFPNEQFRIYKHDN